MSLQQPTPYGKAEDLALENARLVNALRRERKALQGERRKIADALGYCRLVDDHPDLAAHPGFVAVADIRRALDG